MAQFQKNFYQDLNQDVKVRQCGTIVFTGDNESNIITVSLFDGQTPAPQSGSVACYVIRSDGKTVPTITGTIDGNTVAVTLTEACFTRPGPIGVGVQVIDGTIKTTVLKAVYNVETLYTDEVIDPSGEITLNVGDLVQRIDDAVASIPADYSDLLAAIAPNYADLVYPVAAGTWCWYSGSLYRATVDIPAAETWTAEHWKNEAPGNALAGDIQGLKSAIDNRDAVINGTSGLLTLAEPYIIGSSGNWQGANYKHLALPVNSGDTINITTGTKSTVYAFLIDGNVTPSASAHFSEYAPTRIVVDANSTSGDVSVPNDAHYLYLAAVTTQGNIIAPSIKINGVEQTYNIRAKIDSIDSDISEINGDIGEINADIAEIDESIEATNSNVEEIQIAVSDVKKNSVEKSNLDIWGLRGAMPGEFARITLPEFPHLADIAINLYSDGYKFICDADLTKNKNVSAHEFHVSTQTELETALANAQSGDTIYLAPGLYNPIAITKAINLIGEGNGAVFATQSTGGFRETSTAGIYTSVKTLTQPTAVYDASMLASGILTPLQKVGSTTSVVNTPGSWSFTSNKIYVHLFGDAVPTATNVVVSDNTGAVISYTEPTENGTLYLQNITVIGGKYNLRAVANATYTSRRIIAVDCKFVCAYSDNNISLYGVDGLYQRCESFFAYRDGFNYHAHSATGILSNGLEIDCIGHDNGARETGLTSPSNNGSTIHDGGKIVRINGLYYNNNGGNVADTSPGCESYNYGCVAFDSKAPQEDTNTDQTSADFWVRSTAQMYLYGCRALGSSQYNLRTPSAGTAAIHVLNCEYTRATGNVVPIA